MSENLALAVGQDDAARNWAQIYARQSARLAIFACDAPSAQELQRLQRDPRIYVPYYLASQTSMQEPAEDWQQFDENWQRLSFFNLAVRELNSGQLVGCVQFHRHNLSYFVNPDCWQQGYGHEMVQTCCNYMPQLLDIPVLHTTVLRENLASRKILEKAGFVFSGLAKRSQSTRLGGMNAMVLHYRRACPMNLASDANNKAC